MNERSWRLSLDAERDPRTKMLFGLVGKVVADNSELLSYRLGYDVFRSENTFDEDQAQDTLDEYTKTDFYNKLSLDEKKHVARIRNLSSEAVWRFGSTQLTDGLWDVEEAHAAELPFLRQDAIVLTGAVGAELVGISKRLDRLSAAIEPDLFRRTVLLGGFSVSSGADRYLYDYDHYVGPVVDGIGSVTRVGGTIHGDFWTSRQLRADGAIIDPTGVRQKFGPAFETVQVSAYHSTELHIMSALLAYKVAFEGVGRERLYENVTGKVDEDELSHKSAGFFGDFGDDDGWSESVRLEKYITDGIDEGETLARLVYLPQRPERMILTARKEGVEFAFVRLNDSSEAYTTLRSFLLPKNEIEDYAITLLRSGYGRTSQESLLRVIQTLVDGPDRHAR